MNYNGGLILGCTKRERGCGALGRDPGASRPSGSGKATIEGMVNRATDGILSRSLRKAREAWREMGRAMGAKAGGKKASYFSARELKRLRQTMQECVAGVGGEVSARIRAGELGERYRGLDDRGRREFLRLIATEFGPDPEAVRPAIRAYLESPTPAARRQAEARLRETLISPRNRILTQFNALPEGVKFLVDLRSDVLRYAQEDPDLALFEQEIAALLASWFDVGFLELKRITWNSPASLLEKLIAYEAVHEIRSWDDLRDRLDSDRRCYAFFHPRMPNEPLIFLEVALVRDLAHSIQALLDESAPPLDPAKAEAAIFYSISNTQKGLRGISFGNFLLKHVIDDLSRDFPKLKIFATLSPVPGFRRWLEGRVQRSEPLLNAVQAKRLQAAGFGSADALLQVLESPHWWRDGSLGEALREPLLKLCARYLLEEKEGERPLDPVARFHLGNGARLERLNWLADTSEKGMRQSVGIMVNYVYAPADMEKNHERFAREGYVAASRAVFKLAQPGRRD